MLALLLAIALPACGCPPLVERWDTPEATLAQWQARLCRDDVQGEYRCFAASYQRAFRGFENYFAARAELLEQNPGAAWVLRHADLPGASEPTEYATDGARARIVLDAHGQELSIEFEIEAWVTVQYADGTSSTVRQFAGPAALLLLDDGQQWLRFARPTLDAARLPDVRSVHVDPRWLIANLAGLGDLTDPSTSPPDAPPSLRNAP